MLYIFYIFNSQYGTFAGAFIAVKLLYFLWFIELILLVYNAIVMAQRVESRVRN